MRKALAFLETPAFVCGSIVIVSLAALASAYTAQYAFGLEPCPLCLYQRIPYGLNVLLGLAGLSFARRNNVKPAATIIMGAGILFLIGACIAFYHTGVEQRWWASALEGCKINFETTDAQSILEKIAGAASAPCDQIAWQDPVFGLSMANWNMIISFALSDLCVLSGVLILRKRP